MKSWQLVLAGVAVLAVTSALKVGPIRLPNNNRFINYTKGASPQNSLLECVHQLDENEEVLTVSWALWEAGEKVGAYDWYANDAPTTSKRLDGVVSMERNDGSLELTDLRYELSGEYSCSVTLTTNEKQEAAKWEVPVVDSISHFTSLNRRLSGCSYVSDYSTLAMYPKPVVRAGLYSEEMGGFYKEMADSQWHIESHTNGSVTYSYHEVGFELNAETPIDISFYVTVGVMKADGNYIPISSAMDKHIILHQLGCPEPRLQAYQHIKYHRDTITCRGEHQETEATVTCKKGYHADGDVDAVMVTCEEATRMWVLQDGEPAKREHLKCVINGAQNTASISATLLCAALVLHKLFLH